MKILFLTHNFYPDIGGIEINSEILATYFASFGAEVKMLTWSKERKRKNFPFDIIRNPGITDILNAHFWADVVFENNPCLRLSWPVIFTKKNHIVAIRALIKRNNEKVTIIDKLKIQWVRNANGIIAVSRVLKKETSHNAVIIGNPYRNHLFTNLNQKKSKDFVFLGRLVSSKGVDMALQLLSILLKENSAKGQSFHLSIIGDGPERKNLESMVKELAIIKNVSFEGMLEGEELVNCLNKHKYILIPSRGIEGFGNIALEGMACGCLPIVSDAGGLVDAVGEAGIIFERNNMDSFCREVKRLLNNKGLEEKIRNNVPNKLKEHHPEYVSRKYFEIIKGTFSKNEPGNREFSF